MLTPHLPPALSMARSADDNRAMIDLRWMIRRDMPEVVRIERDSYGRDAWSAEEVRRHLTGSAGRAAVAIVLERDGRVLGYMLYDLVPPGFELLRLAVDPAHRRRRLGTALIERLRAKLSQQRRRSIRVVVSEQQLPAQLFLRHHGFVGELLARPARRRAHMAFRYTLPCDAGGLVLCELLHGSGRVLADYELDDRGT